MRKGNLSKKRKTIPLSVLPHVGETPVWTEQKTELLVKLWNAREKTKGEIAFELRCSPMQVHGRLLRINAIVRKLGPLIEQKPEISGNHITVNGKILGARRYKYKRLSSDNEKKTRRCRKCQKDFVQQWDTNYICQGCTKENAEYATGDYSCSIDI